MQNEYGREFDWATQTNQQVRPFVTVSFLKVLSAFTAVGCVRCHKPLIFQLSSPSAFHELGCVWARALRTIELVAPTRDQFLLNSEAAGVVSNADLAQK